TAPAPTRTTAAQHDTRPSAGPRPGANTTGPPRARAAPRTVSATPPISSLRLASPSMTAPVNWATKPAAATTTPTARALTCARGRPSAPPTSETVLTDEPPSRTPGP